MIRIRLAPDDLNFSFMKFRHISYPFSAFMSILSIVLFLTIGLNYGIDFSGGTLMEIRAKTGKADLTELRGLGAKLELGQLEVQAFGNGQDVSVRVPLQPGGDAAQQVAVQKMQDAVKDKYEIRRSEV
ncbi:MAG: protein translocase subunit SecF, partial [Beijerinckiaceae bacterium]|nr:protein translocase subunit SecF [Beijerinckiaceae bacterium]